MVTLLKNNRASDGRLVLDNTRYANSNDLAWTLLVGLIFIGFLYTARQSLAQSNCCADRTVDSSYPVENWI